MKRTDPADPLSGVHEMPGVGRASLVSLDPSADLRLFEIPAPRPVKWEFDLLPPEQCVTPFVGRERPLHDLLQWLREPWTFSTRGVEGPTGSGKTRLAHELIRRLPEGWQGGLVRADQVRLLDPSTLAAPWRWDSPTLAVIDSASLCGPALRKWIESVAIGLALDGPPLRLLLLDRAWNMWDGGLSQCRRAWFHASVDSTRIGPLPISPRRLSHLWVRAHRRSVFQAVRASAAALYGNSEVAAVAEMPTSEPHIDADASPMNLMLLGVVSLGAYLDGSIDGSPGHADTEPNGPDAECASEAAVALALRGRARVQDHPLLQGSPVSAGFASQAIAWITLRDGVPVGEMRSLLNELGRRSNGSVPKDFGPIETVINELLGYREGRILPLPLNEATSAFVICELFGSKGPIRVETAADFLLQTGRLRNEAMSLSLALDHVGYSPTPSSHFLALQEATDRARDLIELRLGAMPADQRREAMEVVLVSGTRSVSDSQVTLVESPCQDLDPQSTEAAVLRALEELERQRRAVRDEIQFEEMDAYWEPPTPEFEAVVEQVGRIRSSDPEGFDRLSKLWTAELVTIWPGVLRKSAVGWEAAIGADCRRLAREDPAIYLPVLTPALRRLCRQLRAPLLPTHPPEELRELTLASGILAVSRPDEYCGWPLTDDWIGELWESVHPDQLACREWLEDANYRLRAVLALPPEGNHIRLSEACVRLARAYFRLGDDVQGFYFAERALGVALRLADEWPERYAEAPTSTLFSLADASLTCLIGARWLTSLADQAIEWGTKSVGPDPERTLGSLQRRLSLCARGFKQRGESDLRQYLLMARLSAVESVSMALPGGLEAELASALAAVSDLQWRMGRPQDALPNVWREIAIYRRLPPERRAEHLDVWFQAVSRLASCLENARRDREALVPFREIIDFINSQGNSPGPDEIDLGSTKRLVLIRALSGLFSLLERLGDLDEAIEIGYQLLKLCYSLPPTGDLEYGLQSLQQLLWRLGRRDEAVRLRMAQASWLTGYLDGEDPLPFIWLGYSYCEQATLQFLLGDTIAADAAICQARSVRDHVENHLHPGWAASASSKLAKALWQMDRPQEAISEGRSTVDLEQRAGDGSRDRSNDSLMLAYSHLAEMLVRPEDAIEALQITGEALLLFETAPTRERAAWSTKVCRCLFGRGRALHSLGRLSEATSAFEQSVAILRTAAECGDGGCKRRLATYLISLCWILSEEERLETALPIAEESVQILRDLSPGAVLPTDTTRLLAEANLAALLLELDRAEEALKVADTALLAPFDPDFQWTAEERHRRAALLSARGGCLCRLDRHEEAEAEFRSGIALLKSVSGSVADLESVPGLPSLLTSLALQLQLLGRSGEALDTAREAEGLLTDHAGMLTPRQTRLLIQCRIAAAQILHGNERLSDALEAASKAVSLVETLPRERSRRGALLAAGARLQVARVLAAQGRADLAMQTLRAAASELRQPTGTAPPANCSTLLDEIAVVAEQIGREHNLPVDLELRRPSDTARVDGDG